MRKLFLLFAIVLVCCPGGFAQSDYSNWEFFIGYAHERANNGGDRLDAQGRAINARRRHVARRLPFQTRSIQRRNWRSRGQCSS